jgi:hypothetical protein
MSGDPVRYEVICIVNGQELWVECLKGEELPDGRLAAKIKSGGVTFRKPGMWRRKRPTCECVDDAGADPDCLNCYGTGFIPEKVEIGDRSDHVRPEIQALIDRGNVTLAELHELRCNSWEWDALVPAMTDEALISRAQRAIDNCGPPEFNYRGSVIGVFAPELMIRFAGASKAATAYAETIDNVREALGQKTTHYHVVAGDVKELVEAVEKQGGHALRVLQRLRGDADELATGEAMAEERE